LGSWQVRALIFVPARYLSTLVKFRPERKAKKTSDVHRLHKVLAAQTD